jgi:hypothetical protein
LLLHQTQDKVLALCSEQLAELGKSFRGAAASIEFSIGYRNLLWTPTVIY